MCGCGSGQLLYIPSSGLYRDRPETHIAPSILSADFGNLAKDCQVILHQGADWLHIDIMDGHFVPNISFGVPVVKSLRQYIPKGQAFFDCHMMVSEPWKWYKVFKDLGIDQYDFHLEAVAGENLTPDSPVNKNAFELIHNIKAEGVRAAMAIKPNTPVECAFPYVEQGLDMVLVMTVEPGFGGQKFMPEMMDKVKRLRKRYPQLDIQVDGGVDARTVDMAADAGANVIVAGSAIFGSIDRIGSIKRLKDSVDVRATQNMR